MTKKSLIFMCLALLIGVLITHAESISVTNLTIEPGQTRNVSISLNNTATNLVSFQMDLTLPEGVAINKSGCTLSSRFTDGDQELTIGKQGDNVYRLISTSYALTPISGTSGEIITLSLATTADSEGGTANISNISFVTSNSERVSLNNVSFSISIVPPSPTITFADANVKALCVSNWDTNGDGELSEAEAATVTDLGEVFKGKTTITSFNELQYFTGLTSIGHESFLGCSVLTNINIPDNVTSLGTSAFYGCNSLASVTMGSCLTSIGDWAFKDCFALTSVIIPNSVTYIGSHAFQNCVELAAANIPEGITSINEYTFCGCIKLESIVIPSSVTSIGELAFYACNMLTTVTLESNALVSATRTYDDTSKTSFSTVFGSQVSEYVIGDGVTAIGDYAFHSCSGMASVVIPNSVTSIGSEAFTGCSGLTSISVENGNTIYDSRDNCNAIINTATNTLIAGCKNTVIPNSVTSIGDYAFSGCSSLTSVTIPNSVTSIGRGAFAGCSDLTSLTIPNSVTCIGIGAFSGCSGLTSVTIPNSVTLIGFGAFWGCIGLTSIIIPDGVTSIGGYAFDGCSNLNSVTMPNNVINFTGSHAFGSNNNIESVYISNLAEWLKTDFGFGNNPLRSGAKLYLNNVEVKDLVIPDGTTSILIAAFEGCESLTSVVIPSSVTSIYSYAFAACPNLTSVSVEQESPLSISSENFSNRTNATLYVPVGSKAVYEAADYWKDFKKIVEMEASITDISQLDNAIYIEPFSARIGANNQIMVKLKNSETVTGFIFDLVLPEGLTIAADGEGNFNEAVKLSSRNNGATIVTNKKSGNIYSIIVASTSSLMGNDGLVLTIKSHVQNDMAVGTYPIVINNSKIVYSNLTQLSIPDTHTSVTTMVADYMTGDVNDDGETDLLDAVLILYHSVGKPVPIFVEEAGDVNKDGEVDLLDAVLILYYSVGKIPSLEEYGGKGLNPQ